MRKIKETEPMERVTGSVGRRGERKTGTKENKTKPSVSKRIRCYNYPEYIKGKKSY